MEAVKLDYATRERLTLQISASPEVRRVTEHRLLASLANPAESTEDRATLSLVLGQYWHPIHYFTEFLPRTIAIVAELDLRAYISKILYQELGSGNASKAHERLYLDAVVRAGFAIDDVCLADPLPATVALVDAYRHASTERLAAVGYLYATELIDLQMVTRVGEAIIKASAGARVEWVTVHDKEEPDHRAAAHSLVSSLAGEEIDQVRRFADDAWARWAEFYDGIISESGEQSRRSDR